MSVSAIDSFDAVALEKSDLSAIDFAKEVMTSRPFQFLQVPDYVYKVYHSLINVSAGIFVDSSKAIDVGFGGFCKKLGVLSSAESLLSLFQDICVFPKEIVSFNKRVVTYLSGQENLTELANGARKLAAHVASTVSDYVFSVSALKEIARENQLIQKADFISEKIGAGAGIFAGLSRIYDYATGAIESSSKYKLAPSAQKARKSLEESRNLYDLIRDISGVALLALTIYSNGYAHVQPVAAAVLTGVVLGARLVSFYRDVQIKKIDDAHPLITKAQKQLKA